MSHKKICEEMSESEVEEMVENGSLQVRKNPANPSRMQYMKVELVRRKELDLTRSIALKGGKKIEDENEWMRMGKNFDNFQVNQKMLMKGGKQAFASIGMAEESEDDDDDDASTVKNKAKNKSSGATECELRRNGASRPYQRGQQAHICQCEDHH